MAITINNNSPRVQYTATSGQTNFTGNWRIESASDIKVYKRAAGSSADDSTDILILTTNYTVTGTQTDSGFTVVLNVGATLNDIVTIIDDRDFEASYTFATNDKFDPDVLNQILAVQDEKIKQLRMEIRKLQPKYQNNESLSSPKDYKFPVLAANQSWRMNQTGTEIDAVEIGDSLPGDSFYGVTTNVGAAYSVTITDFTGYTDGLFMFLKFNATNSTSPVTLNVNGLGAKNVERNEGEPLIGADIFSGATYLVIYHDNKFFIPELMLATETRRGSLQVATQAETDTGTNDQRIITPLKLENKLKEHFGNVYYGITTGGTINYNITISNVTSYQTGLTIILKLNATNTGTPTLNVNGLGAIGIKRNEGTDLSASDMEANNTYILTYTGSIFILLDNVNAVESRSGVARFATQTEVNSNAANLILTPERFRKSAANVKAWANFTGSGSGVTINEQYGISSIVRIGGGRYTINFSFSFANTNYFAIGNGRGPTPGFAALQAFIDDPITVSTNSINIVYKEPSGTNADPASYGNIMFIGSIP